NDVHPRGALVSADLLDPPGEPGDEALVVDAGRVGEAREVSGRHGSPGSCAGGGSSTGHRGGHGGGRRGLDGAPWGRTRRAPAGRAAARRRACRAPTAPPRPPATTPSVNLLRPTFHRSPPAHDPSSVRGHGPLRRMALNRST